MFPIYSANRTIPKRDRPPRVISGSTGLLPPYNRQQAEGQEFLYNINNHDYSEVFVAYECLCSGIENLKVLVSSESVRIISGGMKTIVTQVNLADLLRCQPMQKPQSNNVTLYYIELISRFDSSAAVNLDGLVELLRRPKVRCDNEEIAKHVSIFVYMLYTNNIITFFLFRISIFNSIYRRYHSKSTMLKECTKNAV